MDTSQAQIRPGDADDAAAVAEIVRETPLEHISASGSTCFVRCVGISPSSASGPPDKHRTLFDGLASAVKALSSSVFAPFMGTSQTRVKWTPSGNPMPLRRALTTCLYDAQDLGR